MALQQLLAAHGLGAAEILPIDSLTAQKRMAEAGFGLAILPESSLDEELRTGTLCAIDAPALTASIPVALIRRRNAFQTGAARALTAALTDWPRKPGTQRAAGSRRAWTATTSTGRPPMRWLTSAARARSTATWLRSVRPSSRRRGAHHRWRAARPRKRSTTPIPSAPPGASVTSA